MSKGCLTLYAVGALVSALAALVNLENRVLSFGLLGVGLACIATASWISGVSRPLTAIAMVFVTNLAFWMSFGLWRIRPTLIGPTTGIGIDPFGLAVSVWLFVFLGCVIYESMVLIRGLGDGAQRQVSAMGLAGVVLQIPITIRVIYGMVQGI